MCYSVPVFSRGLTVLLLLSVPLGVFAEGAPVTRREGFLLIWDSIRRPALETSDEPYADVQDFDDGFLEITWAKRRGILDDVANFQPDEPLSIEDALLWIYRTRNVAELEDMGADDLPALLGRYPIADASALGQGRTISQQEAIALQQKLDTMLVEEVHEVSFYAEDFHGDGTAFGETFDMNALTAAHRTFPENTVIRVTNMENGKQVVVRINDRGPYVEGRDLDLSLGAFLAISERSRGKIMARFERLGDASLVDRCAPAGPRYQQRITRDVRFRRGVPHTFTMGDELTLRANRPFVVRGITYPDGAVARMQNFVLSDESFAFTPPVEGTYIFLIGTPEGRQRTMSMKVQSCSENPM